jgi:hypothetical protein
MHSISGQRDNQPMALNFNNVFVIFDFECH